MNKTTTLGEIQKDRATRYPKTHITPAGITLAHKGHGMYTGNGWTLMNSPKLAEGVYMVKHPSTMQKIFPLDQALTWIDKNN